MTLDVYEASFRISWSLDTNQTIIQVGNAKFGLLGNHMDTLGKYSEKYANHQMTKQEYMSALMSMWCTLQRVYGGFISTED